MTDSELIQNILEGDKEQYAELVRRHHLHVIGICRGILGNAVQAEDAAQDIFVKTYQLLPKFRGESSFSTWLYRIATNHCLDLKRKISRQRQESLDHMLEEGFQTPEPGGFEKVLEMKDLSARLLGDLSETERTALVLRESEGLSYDEIADILSVSIDAVKSRLKRARENIEKKVRHFMRPENV